MQLLRGDRDEKDRNSKKLKTANEELR